MPFYAIFRGSEFGVWSILNFYGAKIHEKSKFSAHNSEKMADFGLLGSPKLISRKIWVVENSWMPFSITFLGKSLTFFSFFQDSRSSEPTPLLTRWKKLWRGTRLTSKLKFKKSCWVISLWPDTITKLTKWTTLPSTEIPRKPSM